GDRQKETHQASPQNLDILAGPKPVLANGAAIARAQRVVLALVDFDVQVVARVVSSPPSEVRLAADVGVMDRQKLGERRTLGVEYFLGLVGLSVALRLEVERVRGRGDLQERDAGQCLT